MPTLLWWINDSQVLGATVAVLGANQLQTNCNFKICVSRTSVSIKSVTSTGRLKNHLKLEGKYVGSTSQYVSSFRYLFIHRHKNGGNHQRDCVGVLVQETPGRSVQHKAASPILLGEASIIQLARNVGQEEVRRHAPPMLWMMLSCQKADDEEDDQADYDELSLSSLSSQEFNND